MRNVVIISDMPKELQAWAKTEAQRRRRLRLPGKHFYDVVNAGLKLLRNRTRPGRHTYYLEGAGPYFSVEECLDALGIPQEDRGAYWSRWDRLPQDLHETIERREDA